MNPISDLDAITNSALDLVGDPVPTNQDIVNYIDANLRAIKHDMVFRLDVPPELTARQEELKKLRAAIEALIEAIDEKADLRSGEEAADLGDRFAQIATDLNPFRVALRAEKEAREMGAVVQELPSLTAVMEGAEMRRRIARLEREAQRCNCGRHMKLLDGKFGYFWRCSYPSKCEGKRGLSKHEWAIFNGEKETA